MEFSAPGDAFNFVSGAQQQVDMNFELESKPTNEKDVLLFNNNANDDGTADVGYGILVGTIFKVTIMG